MNFQHYPVMNKEIIEIFRETEQKHFVDCTLGMGGHSYFFLKSFENCRVTGIDMDSESLAKAQKNLAEFGDRVRFLNFNFMDIQEKLGLKKEMDNDISGLLVDPGISIYQLKEHERGFSHSIDAPLDMRKDRNSELTAFHIINSYSEKQLIEIFEKYGEIRNAAQLAKRIIESRLFNPIDTTIKLSAIIEKLYNWKPKRGKTHPAANVFQALRIVVNKELDGFREFLERIPSMLNTGARVIILTFHSVEDRIVKQCFMELQREMKIRIIKPFPAFPSKEEIEINLPSRSVKLRAGEIL